MDLQYCDQCGSILQNRMTSPGKPGESVICEVCKTSPIKEPAASDAGMPASPGVKITLKEGTGSSTATAITETLENEDLTLFSAQTIARRKVESQEVAAEQSKPRIKIVEGAPSEHVKKPSKGINTGDFIYGDTATSVGLKTSASSSSTSLPRNTEKIGLQSIKPRTLNIVEEGEADSGSRSTAKNASQARWKIECPSCRSKLAIRPIEKRSRMNCPRCHNLLVIEMDGAVSLHDHEGGGGEGQHAAREDHSGSEVVSQLSRLLRSNPSASNYGSSWSKLPAGEAAANADAGSASRVVRKSGSMVVRQGAGAQDPAHMEGTAAKDFTVPQVQKAAAARSAWESKGARLSPAMVIFGLAIALLPTLAALLLWNNFEQPQVANLLNSLGTQLQRDIMQVLHWVGR